MGATVIDRPPGGNMAMYSPSTEHPRQRPPLSARLRRAADSVDESRWSECRALAQSVYNLLLRDLLPRLEAEHGAAFRLAYRDHRRDGYPLVLAEVEGFAAKLALLRPKLTPPLSKATANELRHILYGLATLTHAQVDRLPHRDLSLSVGRH